MVALVLLLAVVVGGTLNESVGGVPEGTVQVAVGARTSTPIARSRPEARWRRSGPTVVSTPSE